MRRTNLEMTVGVFVLLGMACLAYLAINLGKMEIIGKGYQIFATFDNVSGLKTGAPVEVAGVEVGQVDSIQLTPIPGPGRHEIAAGGQGARRCHRLHPHQGDHWG